MAPTPDFLNSFPHRVRVRERHREGVMFWALEHAEGRIYAAELMGPDIMAWVNVGPDDMIEIACQDENDAFTLKMMFG